jgi:ABC-type proline/glycine betaine transport system ATPase subunit
MSDTKGTIYIDGEGDKKYWTEKAVNRAGFTVSKERTFPYITLPSNSNLCWQLSGQSIIQEFSSIYELILYLNNETIRPI